MASINTNVTAIQTYSVYNKNNAYMNSALSKVATGQRINTAKDSPADWAISERMRERINSLNQAGQNVQNDNAMMKTAEEGIVNTVDILKTLKERALNAANASTSEDDRKVLQNEVDQLVKQIDTNAESVKFNGIQLLTGVGAEEDDDDTSGITNLLAFSGESGSSTDITVDSTLAAAGLLTSGTGKAVTLSWTSSDGTAHTDEDTEVTVGATGNKVSDLINALNELNSDSGLTFSFVAKGDVVGQDATSGNDLKAKANGIKVTGSEGTTGISFKIDSTSFSLSALSNTNTEEVEEGETSVDATTVTDSGNRWFQIGADSDMQITFSISSMKASDLGVDKLNLKNPDAAAASIEAIDGALTKALKEATKIGALEQRLGYTADNIATQIENMEASDSAIRDADIAKEMTNYMKYMVLSQASQYMLAQSNQNGFSVLNLLQA